MKLSKLLNKLFFSYSFIKPHPEVGDKVRTKVGFGTTLEGTVRRVVINDHDAYCWIDVHNSKGECIRSGTASFSYCNFEYL